MKTPISQRRAKNNAKAFNEYFEANREPSAFERSLNKLSQDELIELLVTTAKEVKRCYVKSNKSAKTEIQAGLTTRAKSTTLVANSYKAQKVYQTNVDYFKKITNKLL
jgi:hypothetical protein